MHKLFQGARHHTPTNVNKPLPEPLVDPDEGKTPIGELVIIPIHGRDLPNRERFGKQDPFILFKLGNVSKRSSTDIRGGQRPRWKDDQIQMLIYESEAKDATSLYVTCLDEDHQKNDLIGDCVINLAKVLEKGEHDDWFELSYKGREAGEIMLQLTYYSHDSKHPLHKLNRVPSTPVPSGGQPGRRPIHPVNHVVQAVKADAAAIKAESATTTPPTAAPFQPISQATSPAVPLPDPKVVSTHVPSNLDSIPTYQPPATATAAPSNSAYGGRISPSPQNQYIGHPAPQVAPNRPFGQQLPPGGSPYSTVNGFPGYPTPNTHYSPQQPQPQQQRPDLYPPVGYPPQNIGGYPPQQQGYPPQQFYPPGAGGGMGGGGGAAGAGYPPQFNTFNGYPPQMNNQGYPPPHNTFNGYPPQLNNNGNNIGFCPPGNSGPQGFYPPSQPSMPSAGGYPPSGYPFAATTQGLYPPIQTVVSGNGGSIQGQGPRPLPIPTVSSSSSSSSSRPVPPIPTTTSAAPSSFGGSSTLPGSFPGSFPGAYPDTSNFGGDLGGHKVSVNHGQTTSTFPNGYPPRTRSASPPALPPRNNQSQNLPPSYSQAIYGSR